MARTANLTDEKEVEDLYRESIRRLRAGVGYDFRHNTDGYARWGNVRLLLEVKIKENLRNRKACCKVLGQLLYYLKKFERDGEVPPNVLLAGDETHFFVVPTASVVGFLNTDGVDWSAAPSAGSKVLLKALEDQAIIPPLYEVGTKDFREALLKCESISEDVGHHTKATPENISTMFSVRWAGVVKDPDLTPVEHVDVFLKCLFRPSGVALLKGNQLHVPGYEDAIKVDSRAYEAFVAHFHQGYSPTEVEHFYSMKDRLVEEVARRRQGAFFTPDIWVAEAHKEIEKVLGPKWKDECIVWDPAAGTANLTRDYAFRDLIISTAEKPDVQVIRDQGYNKGASVFQYDFLNPGGDSPFLEKDQRNTLPLSVERQLQAAAKTGKRLVFFMNPPYGTATNQKGKGSKDLIASTTVGMRMKAAKMGPCSQQLYAQFLHEAVGLANQFKFKNYTVAIYSQPTFMGSSSYSQFRPYWYRAHEYKGGFLFQASHFSDVVGRWGVSFTVWNSGGQTSTLSGVPLHLKDLEGLEVKDFGVKVLYSANGKEASSWVREPISHIQGVDAPQFCSGLKVVEDSGLGGKMVPGGLFYMTNSGNPVRYNAQEVYFTSSCGHLAHGLSGHPLNFRRVVALFAARKMVDGNWVNNQDEYLAPDETASGYDQWVNDCHVYSLLPVSNNCTAMRDVQYKGKAHRIKNHWFWMTKAEALAAYNTPGTPHLYRDCKEEPSGHTAEPDLFTPAPEVETWRENGDPYFAHVLPGLALSGEAKKVLDLLKALHLKSLPVREEYSNAHPELHLNAWDAGVYQLKHLWRAEFPEEWKELQVAFKVLEEKLRPGVYEYGFLLR